MKILGVDTSSSFLSIALSKDRDVMIEENTLLDKRHSSMLVPNIKSMLEKIGLSISDVDGYVVGLGPGSFTGLRIGVSTIKGFLVGTKKVCLGMPSIDAIAMNADHGSLIVPIIDAKRSNVYSAIYERKKGGIIRKSGYLLLGIDELSKKVKKDAVFLGDGVKLYKDRIQELNKKALFLGEEYWYPRASNLIRLAVSKKSNFKKKSLVNLDPIYLYPRYCQIKR
ncbi:MAG: tRNA (adenosine(37)-N6)-threonylcarbamoyltransferase complex dimerization subunit type 1 TsaB [Candidatus Omnitrophota bacterium]